LDAVDLATTDLLFIENVGNLVCPAAWDLGETGKIALFSVTEGEDKPEKYPKMFRMAQWVVFTKLDLLPHVPFSLERAVDIARQVNPTLDFLMTSAVAPDGMDEWLGFCRAQARRGVTA
jgi:hydrogenase nickel incorporation protein HypB